MPVGLRSSRLSTSTAMTTAGDLPKGMLVRILVSTYPGSGVALDIFSTIPLVCKAWRAAACETANYLPRLALPRWPRLYRDIHTFSLNQDACEEKSSQDLVPWTLGITVEKNINVASLLIEDGK